MKIICIAIVATSISTNVALGAESGTRSVTKVLVAPDWIRKPTGDEFAAVYPTVAEDKRQNGKSLIRCEIDKKGGLKDCAVLAEFPANAGFGRAALKLADKFRAPANLAGDEVVIPIGFRLSPGPPTRAVLAKHPQFMATPTADEVIEAFPKAAIGHAEKGVVHLHCVHGCVVSSAEPSGIGFEEAAVALSKRFKLDPVWQYRIDAEEVQYDLVVQLAPADSSVWKTRPLGHIEWLDTADPQMAQSAFPAAALKAGLHSGSAIVACTVGGTGVLKDCAVDSEDPPGLGFGQAVVEVAQHYVMNPWTDEGLPAAGAHVRLPMKLVHEGDPAPAPSPATKP